MSNLSVGKSSVRKTQTPPSVAAGERSGEAKEAKGAGQQVAANRVAQGNAPFSSLAARRNADTFESAPLQARASRGTSGAQPVVANNQNDKAYDGHLVGRGQINEKGERQVLAYPPGTRPQDVAPFEPQGGARNNATVIYVNGIQNNIFDQARNLQQIADVTGSRTVGIHNSTESFAKDVTQSGLDKLLNGGGNKAVSSLRDTILNELRAGRPVHLMGHSQGGLITAKALNQVNDYINRPSWLGGPSADEAKRLREGFNNMKVETFGSAAAQYPQGPRYVHYLNTRDPVPNWFGLGGLGTNKDLPAGKKFNLLDNVLQNPQIELQRRAGGERATVNFIDDKRGFAFDNHDFGIGYLNNRVDFEQAWSGQFNDRNTRNAAPAGSLAERYDLNGSAP